MISFTGEGNFIKNLQNKKATFLLAASVTKTCDIEGITQAGIPGLIHLTPTLDAEFISTGKVFSLPELAETPNGVPTPALITKAVDNLEGFSSIEVANLGLEVLPKQTKLYNFDISPSQRIDKGANIDAKAVFLKGMEFGSKYELKGSYLIVGESTPAGTTTAEASIRALGYDVKGCFSSSFLDNPKDIKEQTIQKALSLIDENMSDFEKLGIVSDNMLLFTAGFIYEATKRFEVVLAGGTQMAAVMLIADKLRETMLLRPNHNNLTLATTKWVAKDEKSDIKKLLSFLSYKPNAIYTTFSFASAEIEVLKKYDIGEAKEGVGAGGALSYANAHGLKNNDIVQNIELMMYEMM
jgi:uncharacterized protein (TIGR00303 family)